MRNRLLSETAASDAAADEFRLIADSAPVPIWVTGLDRRRTFVNTAYVAFVGGDIDHARDLDWRTILHPEDVARIVEESVAGEASLGTFTMEARYRRGDGEWRWLRSVSQPRWNAAGEHCGFIGVAHDITEAKRAADAVAEREEQLRAFVSQSTAGFAQTDLTGRFTLVNDRFCEIAGRDRETLMQMRMQDITHADDLPRNLPLFERAVRDGTPYTHEKRYIRPDGAQVWVNNSVAVIRKPDGLPYGVLAVTLDVTARREAEAALRRSEENVRLAVEGAGMAAWEVDLTTRRGRWSSNRFDLLGLPQTADESGTVEDWLARVHPDDAERARAAIETCLRDGTPYTIAYRIRRADTGAERWLQSHGSRIADADGKPGRFVGVSFDITEVKLGHQRQSLLIDELNHRVKNMLAIVQGIAQQTMKPPAGLADARAAFEGRLGALAAAHSLLTEQRWAPVSLTRLMAAALAPHASADRIAMNGPDLMIAPKTAVSLALAMHELATNAVKYGALVGADGYVDVAWSTADAAGAPRLRLIWREHGGPRVETPRRRGFGTRMIERGLAAELGGTVAIDFAAEGVVCVVDAPLPEA